MTNLTVFDFKSNEVRVLTIDNQPWFVNNDVCKALEIANPRDALLRLDADEKGVGLSDTLGGNQDVAIVSEAGLYSLVLTSRKPQAKEFKRWIVHEVIPSIRKTGEYKIVSKQAEPLSQIQILQQAINIIAEQEQKILAIDSRVTELETNKEQAQKLLSEAPTSDDEALPMSDRAKLNYLVRQYCRSSNVEHRTVWNRLYTELYYRYGFSAKTRAENRGISSLDAVEEAGMMSAIFAIASEILKSE